MNSIGERYLELLRRIDEIEAEKGQDLAEFGLILALIAIVAIAALTMLGDGLVVIFERVECYLSGGWKC